MFNTTFNLPAELTLAVLAYLPISSIAVLPQVCRNWRSFIDANRDAIYHKAAVWHGFIPSPSTSLFELKLWYSGRSLREVNSWHDFCRRRYDIDRAWSAQAPSAIATHHATGTSVHRIKVDEQAEYIITTKSDGGLTVTDLEEDIVLWSLPPTHVRRYAHCEYGEGFIIFDRNDGSKEVWRRSSDCSPDEASTIVPESQPTILNSEFLALPPQCSHPSTRNSSRGHFQPWAHLHPPEPTRAFRFSYPILGVAAINSVYLWDVRTGALIQTIQDTQFAQWNGAGNTPGDGDGAATLRFLGDINYIEVGARHVFLCGIHALRVFAWDTGRCVLDVPSSQTPYGKWWFRISSEERVERVQGAVAIKQSVAVGEQLRGAGEIVNEFIAVHVSSCGRHIAALLHSSRLVIIRDFECATRNSLSIYDLAFEVQLGSPCFSSRYLAYENGRIAVATRTGVFIVRPVFSDSNPGIIGVENNSSVGLHEDGVPYPEPEVEIVRIPPFGTRSCLRRISCLQMTDTGLFLNWDPIVLSNGGEEESFYSSLHDETRYANVANVQVILVDMSEDEEDVAEEDEQAWSTVLSVDFTPI